MVRGASGRGLRRRDILATFERRLGNPPAYERAEALRNIHRIAEIRLNDKFGVDLRWGRQGLFDCAEQLANRSDGAGSGQRPGPLQRPASSPSPT